MDNLAAIVQSLSVLIAAGIGFAANGITQAAADKRRISAERDIRLDDRAHERLSRSHDMQLDVLRKLPEALRLVMRDTALRITADRESIQEVGKFAFPLPSHLDAEAFDHGIAYSALIVLVVNDDLRMSLEKIRSYCTECSRPPEDWRDLSKNEMRAIADSRWQRLAAEYEPVAELLGKRLREAIR